MENWSMHQFTNKPLVALDRNEFADVGNNMMKAGLEANNQKFPLGTLARKRALMTATFPHTLPGPVKAHVAHRPLSRESHKAGGNSFMRAPCGPPSPYATKKAVTCAPTSVGEAQARC